MPRIQDLVLSNLTIEPTSNTQIGLSISGIAVFNNNLTVGGNTTITGDLLVKGGDITNATAATPVNVFATTTGLLTLGGGPVNVGASGSTTTVDGSLTVVGSGQFNNTLAVTGDTTITGNLSVLGATTTVQSVITVYQDPILQIGGTIAPTSDDNKDRGISFYYYDNGTAKTGFIG